jgi:hypothetical protein
MLPRCSPEDIRDGDDHNFADSGESLQRRTVKIQRLRLNEFDSRSMDAQSIMVELRGLFSWHGRAYSGEVKFAGARVCGHLQRRARERKGCSSRVPLAAENVFIVVQDRASGSPPPSSFPARGRRRWLPPLHGSEAVCWVGLSPGPCWASARWLRPGKSFLLFFFCSVSFLLFPVFCFAISNTSFNFVFADFEFRSVLKYTNDIFGPNMCYYIYHVCALAHKMLKDHWDLSRF